MDRWQEMLAAAREIDRSYQEKDNERLGRPWSLAEFFSQCSADWGELSEEIGRFEGYRPGQYSKDRARHELGDLLWALIVLSDRLDIPLDAALLETMEELKERLRDSS
jgi:NTP pyrophosphatase (non-canonical NTP hydrolase)